MVYNGVVDVDVDDVVLDAFDVVKGAARSVKLLGLNDGVVIAPAGITQNSNGLVIAIVAHDVRWLMDTR